jgi:hypothetical protein
LRKTTQLSALDVCLPAKDGQVAEELHLTSKKGDVFLQRSMLLDFDLELC